MKAKWFSLVLLTIIISMAIASGRDAKAEYILPEKNNLQIENSDINFLQRMEKAFSSITEEASKSVVFINVSKYVKTPDYFYLDPFEEFFGFRRGAGFGRDRTPPKREVQGLGSGFIIDNQNGYIMTNNHVVGDADKIRVTAFNGKEFAAKVVGRDEKTDVAVIKIENLPRGLGQIHLANMDDVRVGNWAIAIGAPMGLKQTVTRGIVSAKGRGTLDITGYGDFIQTDAAINPGNSGGPLVNSRGEAIGMNTAIFSKSGGSQGAGFAIPSDILKVIAQKLISDGVVKRSYLGVVIQELTLEMAKMYKLPIGTGGVLVGHVEEGTPAHEAGIKSEDIITKINDKMVDRPENLSFAVSVSPVGTKVPIELYRGGQKKTINVVLIYREEDRLLGQTKEGSGILEDWGVSLSHDLVIEEIYPRSFTAMTGLNVGDKIIEVNRNKVKNLSEFRKYLSRNSLFLKVERGNMYLFVMLKR